MYVHRRRVVTALVLGLTALSMVPLACHFLAQPAPAQDKASTPKVKVGGGDEKTIRELITQLGDDAFDNRQAAQKRLVAIGEPALELVRKASKECADAEVRARAGRVILE